MSEEIVNLNKEDKFNLSMALDLNFFLLSKIVDVFQNQYPTDRDKLGLVNDLLEQWEGRLIRQQNEMNKINAHALASANEEITEDVADILMDIHSTDTNISRKEFKRFVRHILRQAIEGKFEKKGE